MAVILWLMGVALLTQGSLCRTDEIMVGCKMWNISGDHVCCEECHPGNRLVRECGPRPKDLCTPCEVGSFTLNPKNYKCDRCTECVDVQVMLESCTATSNTKCDCAEGYLCGDERCSFCTEKCDKGYEPTSNRSCRPCPPGTYNDKIQQKCKSWSSKCPNPDQMMVTKGNATSDIQCVSPAPVISTKKPDDPDNFATTLIIGTVLMASLIIIFIIIAVAWRFKRKEKKPEKPNSKTPIIRPPTDEPRTLIAIECSFNEAQQEQGSSTESLISKEPAGHLII